MPTFFIRHHVKDFDTWHEPYLAARDIQQQGGVTDKVGVTDKAVFRDAENPTWSW